LIQSQLPISRRDQGAGEDFVERYWPETTCLADEIFKHGRLDRQQIVAVLAPPLGGVVPRANAALWLADRPPRAGFSHLRLLTRFPPFFRWQKCDISVAFCSIFR